MAHLPYTFKPDLRPLTPQEQLEREKLIRALCDIETKINFALGQIRCDLERIIQNAPLSH